MGLLQYTSDEMYSSTDLIRKSKKIYDKISNKEIEKAIILRDGKPSFMLLDFETYEKIMNEYLEMKGSTSLTKKKRKPKKAKEVDNIDLEEHKIAQSTETLIETQVEQVEEVLSEKEQEKEAEKAQQEAIESKDVINQDEINSDQIIQEPKRVEKKLAVNQDALKEILANTENHKVPPKEPGTIRQKLKEFWD